MNKIYGNIESRKKKTFENFITIWLILHQLVYFMVTISFAEIFINIQLCELCMNKIN